MTHMSNKMTERGINMIKQFEGLRRLAYKDQGGIWTIGWGHTGKVDGVKVGRDMVITIEKANELFNEDIKAARLAVGKIEIPLNDNQYSALVSFAFNIGVGAFKKSTLLKKLKLGDHFGAAKEFSRWVYVKKKISRGLERRREAEVNLFCSFPED